jgi:hypothetical protein
MFKWRGQPIFGEYLIQEFHTATNSSLIDTEIQITIGNEYFQTMPELERGKPL